MKAQGAYNLLFRPGLRADFRDSFEEYPPEYNQYLKTGTMDRPEIEAAVIAGPNRLKEVGDLEGTTFFDAKLSGKVAGVDKEFSGGYGVSQRAVEDDQYNKINQGAKWLGEAARLTYEYRSAALLDDAFTGSTFLGIDGLALCHTAHVLFNAPLGTTMQNRPTLEVGFSLAGIDALLELHELHKNWNGDPVRSIPDTVIYSPKYIGVAMQIFGSELEPFTAGNQINATRKRLANVKQVVARYKTSAESYFLNDSRKNDAQFLTRVALSLKDWIDEDTGAMLVKARVRFLVWFADFHSWTGSNPT